MPITVERLPRLMFAALLAIVWTTQAHSQDFPLRLERLEQLTYSGSSQQIKDEIERLEAMLDQADPRQRTRFTLLKARAAALAKNSEQAIDLLDGMLADRSGLDPDLELRALNLATNLLVIEDRFEAGFDYFREALELAPGVRASAMRADTYSVAAEFHARIGEYATAIEYANLAMEQVTREEAPRAHCVAMERRARARLGLQQPDQAIADYRTAVDLCQSIPDLVFAGISRIGLAVGLRERGIDEAAESNLERAVEMLARSGFVEGELEARYRLAELMLDQDRLDDAVQVMAPTLPWIETPGSHAIRAGAMRVHARIAALEENQRLEYEYTRRAIEFSQQQAARIRHMRFTLLMSAQDDRARERELELLRSQNALAELDRESRRQEELALTMGGFGAVVAGVLLLALLVKAARDRQQFQRLSQRDGLTGLYNHTRFFELAQQAFQRARQNAMPFSLIVADIDLFKQVNDEYGHLVGDSVLERIGSRLRAAFESDAIIGRLGGEEFGIALVDCDIDTAVARIEHFRATLNRRRSGEDEPAVTMSFGVAELSRERSLDVLYAHADQALYDAKDAGRNRVITVARINLTGGEFVT
tara:strand:- start:1862 stop:3640 length:1779 start_codon:yes stop_codon:yes gene_type:complete